MNLLLISAYFIIGLTFAGYADSKEKTGGQLWVIIIFWPLNIPLAFGAWLKKVLS